MQSRLKATHRSVLIAVKDRAMDIPDLAQKLGADTYRTYVTCVSMRDLGLIDWPYPEDEISPSPEGRAALVKEGK